MSDRRVVRWYEDQHDISELWVCIHCDAHLHADCVGDKCPRCGEEATDYEEQ